MSPKSVRLLAHEESPIDNSDPTGLTAGLDQKTWARRGLSIILCICIGFASTLQISLPLSFACLLAAFILLCIVAAQSRQSRIVALTFVGMLFLFLVGNAINVFSWQTSNNVNNYLATLFGVASIAQILAVYRILTYCSLGLTLGLALAPQRFFLNHNAARVDKNYPVARTRIPVPLYAAFVVALLCNIASTWEVGRFVSQQGYAAYYTSFSSNLPRIVRYCGIALNLVYFTILAIVRRGRALVVPTALYLAAAALTLMTGRRNSFMVPLVIVLVYFFHQTFARPGSVPRGLVRRVVVILVLVGVPLMVFMQVLFNLRTNSTTAGLNPADFLTDQGGSIVTVGYVVLLGNGLPDKPYAFGSILLQLQGYVCRWGICSPPITGQTAEAALLSPRLSDTLTYAINPDAYLAGYGYGTSFVGELFAEFGLAGVLIGSIFYGLLITATARWLSSESVILTIVALLVLNNLLFSPRSGFSDFLLGILSTQNLVWLACVWLVLRWQSQRRIRRVKPQLLHGGIE